MKLSGDTITAADVTKIGGLLYTAWAEAAAVESEMQEGEIDLEEAAERLNAMFDDLKAELDDERDGLQNPLSEIGDMMKQYGGSFVQSLADSMRYADGENMSKILSTWPEVFERYDAIATLESAKSKEVKS
jgi:hypothetical protein